MTDLIGFSREDAGQPPSLAPAYGSTVPRSPRQPLVRIPPTLTELTGIYLPSMSKARHGVVLNVASTASFQPTPGMAVYGATKAYVLSFTEALWKETKGSGIRVLALCPGATDTEFFARTGEEFLTSGRQTSKQVVDVAMAALDKSTPTVVSGLANTLLATGYRFTPRRVMLEVSQRLLKAN